MSAEEVLGRLRRMQADDVPVGGGRTLAYVYDSGDPEVERLGREAVAAYAGSNALDPTAFPSLLTMENELVGRTCDLLGAPAGTVGTVTSGGTESCLLAVQAARDARPEVARPRLVAPTTVHPAFHKAAHYFGVELVLVDVGPDHRADPAAMVAALEQDPTATVLVVLSAPSYAHGVVDPVTEVAAAAARHGARVHVDACIGGWVLPYAARLGRPVTPWTFAVDGVTSISVDLHKYAYAPKGTSVLLHRTAALHRPAYFTSARWPGYTMLNSTMQSTRSGGPLAGAWAVVQHLGDEGYLALARRLLTAVDRIAEGVEAVEGLHLLAEPDASLVAVGTDGTLDVFTLTALMADAGWLVQPQLSYAGHPPSLHLSPAAATADHVEELLADLAACTARARERGPVAVDPGIAELLRTLDPATLGEDDLDGLLAAAGLDLDPASGPPQATPEVNALLDVAPPALREAVLAHVLDRVQRPTRA